VIAPEGCFVEEIVTPPVQAFAGVDPDRPFFTGFQFHGLHNTIRISHSCLAGNLLAMCGAYSSRAGPAGCVLIRVLLPGNLRAWMVRMTRINATPLYF
jgi:hypothetical protein